MHHRFSLKPHRRQIDALDAAISRIDAEVEANLAPFRDAIEILTSIPGVGNLSALSAQVIVAGIGMPGHYFVPMRGVDIVGSPAGFFWGALGAQCVIEPLSKNEWVVASAGGSFRPGAFLCSAGAIPPSRPTQVSGRHAQELSRMAAPSAATRRACS